MRASRRHLKRLFVSVSSIAISGALAGATPALAQNATLDLSDPYVSVDLSVLDGTSAPSSTLSVGAPDAGPTGHLVPGPMAPVSTLHISPEGSFMVLPVPSVAKAPERAPEPEAVQAADIAPPPPVVETPEPVQAEIETPAPVEPPVVTQVAEPEPAPEPIAAPEPPVAEITPPAPPPPVVAVVEPVAEPVAEPVPLQPAPEAEVEAAPPPPPPALTPPVAQAEPTPTPEPVQPEVQAPTAQTGVASLPPADEPIKDGTTMRIVFGAESSKLPTDSRDALKALAGQLKQNEDFRLQLLAYAGDADMPASSARRLSLARALEVRTYLIESGVRSTRIDVRALGNKSADDVTERVDITVIER